MNVTLICPECEGETQELRDLVCPACHYCLCGGDQASDEALTEYFEVRLG